MTVTGLGLPDTELADVLTAAETWGVDPRLLGALRKVEHGGPGREFGVMDPKAKTLAQQAEYAAATIRHTMGRFCGVGHDAPHPTGALGNPLLYDLRTGRLTDDFLAYFSHGGLGYPGYAPLGAANDPHGLNQHHLPNLLAWYARAELAP